MFIHGFPPEWSTFKKLIWLVGAGIIGGASAVWKTVTGTLIHITDALASPMQKCEVTLEPIQAGSGDPSPTNVRPITGWTGCEVTRTGENLLNKADMKNSRSDPRFAKFGVNNYDDTFPNGSIMLDVGNYVFSLSGTNSTNAESISVYDDTNTRIKIVYNNKICSFTITKAGAYYINFVIAGGKFVSWDNYDIQLERGTTPTDYKAPNIATASVTFPDSAGTVYGGTVDLVSGILTITWAGISLDGSQNISVVNWIPQTNAVGWLYPYSLTQNVIGTGTVVQPVMSDSLPTVKFNSMPTLNDNGIALENSGNYGIAILQTDTSLTTKALINAYLEQNPIQVVFKLATPIDIQLTPQEISTLKGVNNVWSNSNGETTLIYKAQAE